MATTRTTWTQHIGAALYYAVASTAVQFSNKALFATYLFRFPIFLGTMQLAFVATWTWASTRATINRETAVKIMPICIVRMLNLVSGLVGTQQINIPMFVALRRLTMVFTITLEYILLRKVQPVETVGAVGLMVGGALVAAATDLTFDLKGYTAIFANDLFTALYLVLVKRSPEVAALPTQVLMLYNSVMSLPMMMGLVVAMGDIGGVQGYLAGPLKSGFYFTLFCSATMGLAIDHSTFTSIKVNGPLATSVTGSMKNIVTTLFGAFAFGDFLYSPYNVGGLGVSMVGSIWYTLSSAWRKHQQTLEDARKGGEEEGGEYGGAAVKNTAQ